MFWNKTKSVTTDELQAMLKERPAILDVREAYEFKNGHIPGAKNLPLAKVDTYTGKGPVYVICQSGARSSSATKKTDQNGRRCHQCQRRHEHVERSKKIMKIVIVGGVAGGMSAATRLRRLNEDAEIIILEKGPYVSFAQLWTSLFRIRRDHQEIEAPGPDPRKPERQIRTGCKSQHMKRFPLILKRRRSL